MLRNPKLGNVAAVGHRGRITAAFKPFVALGVVDSSPLAYAEFDSRGLQAGGYTWIAILHSLAKIESIQGEFEIGGEGDNSYVNAHDPAILDAFAKAIQRAMTDLTYLRAALDCADPDLLE